MTQSLEQIAKMKIEPHIPVEAGDTLIAVYSNPGQELFRVTPEGKVIKREDISWDESALHLFAAIEKRGFELQKPLKQIAEQMAKALELALQVNGLITKDKIEQALTAYREWEGRQ